MPGLVQIDIPTEIPYPSFAPSEGALVDRFGRSHTDLRISVTDRCNIRCFYCMPEQDAAFTPSANLLTFDQIIRIVEASVKLGVDKIRLTGGEPLLRPRLPQLIERLAQVKGLRDIALTTNGVLLRKYARSLYDAGLRRLNVHLDTLDRERFRTLSRRDELTRVLEGIETAKATGFQSIKLNAVAIKGFSEPDLVPLTRFARDNGMQIRFIEFMPLDSQNLWGLDQVLTADRMIEILEAEFGPLSAVPDADPRAPASEYKWATGEQVGFIASISRPFCLNCNRLRLTADGRIRNCLFARHETDIRAFLRDDGDSELLENAIRQTVWDKWEGHNIDTPQFLPPERPMYAIGG